MAGGTEATGQEVSAYVEVCETLGAKKQIERRVLGDKPLTVIRSCGRKDFEGVYNAGVEAGNGTSEQRRAFHELLQKWDDMDRELKEEQLKLSRNSRMVFLPDCGHNVQLLRPDVVASEIQLMMDSFAQQSRMGLL